MKIFLNFLLFLPLFLFQSETCPTIIATSTNGGSSEAMLDESDGTQHVEVDVQRTKAAIEHLNAKIIRTMDMIKTEQGAKEGTSFY